MDVPVVGPERTVGEPVGERLAMLPQLRRRLPEVPEHPLASRVRIVEATEDRDGLMIATGVEMLDRVLKGRLAIADHVVAGAGDGGEKVQREDDENN
jgi:hypothetical protein